MKPSVEVVSVRPSAYLLRLCNHSMKYCTSRYSGLALHCKGEAASVTGSHTMYLAKWKQPRRDTPIRERINTDSPSLVRLEATSHLTFSFLFFFILRYAADFDGAKYVMQVVWGGKSCDQLEPKPCVFILSMTREWIKARC